MFIVISHKCIQRVSEKRKDQRQHPDHKKNPKRNPFPLIFNKNHLGREQQRN